MEGRVDNIARWCQSARLGPSKSSPLPWGVGEREAPSSRGGLGGSQGTSAGEPKSALWASPGPGLRQFQDQHPLPPD